MTNDNASTPVATTALADHSRSHLVELAPGDRIIDAGTLVIEARGAPARQEAFEYIESDDGGLVVGSVIDAGDGSYHFDCRWEYTPTLQLIRAAARGRNGDRKTAVDIAAIPPTARLSWLDSEGKPQAAEIPFAAGWLADLEPSAIAMWIMIRRYSQEQGAPEDFHWIGRSLVRDQTLEHGVIQLRCEGDDVIGIPGPQTRVRHFSFVETLPQPGGGAPVQLHFDLWADAELRPMKFFIDGKRFKVTGARLSDRSQTCLDAAPQ